ncbi:hypothetical protein K501DRAFT_306365, partial [Backusella circina FSU 941]
MTFQFCIYCYSPIVHPKVPKSNMRACYIWKNLKQPRLDVCCWCWYLSHDKTSSWHKLPSLHT